MNQEVSKDFDETDGRSGTEESFYWDRDTDFYNEEFDPGSG